MTFDEVNEKVGRFVKCVFAAVIGVQVFGSPWNLALIFYAALAVLLQSGPLGGLYGFPAD